jgi:uncharacterized protein YdiU (UPF0061 family)
LTIVKIIGNNWFKKYAKRLDIERVSSKERRKEKMNLVNPKYVLRNLMSQMAN